jgi:hypothetical protein
MVEIRGVYWQRCCSAGGCRKWLRSEGLLTEMVQCWRLQAMVEIRGVCWQRRCSAGGCKNWLRPEGCVVRDSAVLVAAGNG